MSAEPEHDLDSTAIAIVGMAARLPGARNVGEYWRMLRDGVEAIRDLSDEELTSAGVSSDALRNPRYIKRGAVLERLKSFDAEFFGFGPKEASILDPQHRHFLETCWEALEDAAHAPERFDGRIGVFASCGMGAYFSFNLLTNPDLVKNTGLFLLRHTGNDKDFLATRVSYCFNLTGPSMNVQTACSSSLVAIHCAVQSLLAGEADMALAGGVTIELPHGRGYLYQQGEILSPDGHCHAFDHRAAGTIFGSGAGVVVLRRLADALADGDQIYAVIKGSAVNNDGAGKIGYFAPSVDGQAAVIAEALSVAGVSADEMNYVECHGTGTAVGDPIEIAGLTQAYRQTSSRSQFCGIGSVKTNIGHLDTAAGVASLMKVALALRHEQLPATLNFERPNPELGLENTPFVVNAALRSWPREQTPRIAGVTSLGVGGTNAHVVLGEAPTQVASSPSKQKWQLLTLSARNRGALDAGAERLAAHLQSTPTNLADAAYTLHVGRKGFDLRRVVAIRETTEAAELLAANDSQRVFTHRAVAKPSTVFLFPGGGAQYHRMGHGLYETQPVFKQWVDRGLKALQGKIDVDLKALLFSSPEQRESAATILERPSIQLPAIFIIEMALAQLWLDWGVRPAALLGHSMGENTAACLAGVMSYEDALGLVTLRGKLFERVPPGGMLSISLPATEVRDMLGDELDLATANAPKLCSVSGPCEALEKLRIELEARGVEAKRIPINIAAHSRLLDPILDEFRAYLRSIRLSPPQIPIISNRTAVWLTAEEATSPDYWVDHLRNTVLFAGGVGELLQTPGRVFIEVGPGKTLGSLVRQHPLATKELNVISTLRHPQESIADEGFFLTALGRAWASGIAVPLERLWKNERRQRISLPTYAFQHQDYWIEPGKASAEDDSWKHLPRAESIDQWFYEPRWKPRYAEPAAESLAPQTWLVFVDDSVGDQFVSRLRAAGHTVVTVATSDRFHRRDAQHFTISPEQGRHDYDALMHELNAGGLIPQQIVHLWLHTRDESFRPGSSFFHRTQEQGFYSLLFLAQSWQSEGWPAPRLTIVTNGLTAVADERAKHFAKATILGPARVIPREWSGATASVIDFALPQPRKSWWPDRKAAQAELARTIDALWDELQTEPANRMVAIRAEKRFEQVVERLSLKTTEESSLLLRDHGVYLITGGFGGMGHAIAGMLAAKHQAKLVLLSRTELPSREQWNAPLADRQWSADVRERVRQVQELEALGGEVLVIAADVTDPVATRAAFETIKQQFGALHGVIHTAGVLRDGLMATKSQSEIEEVFSAKVHGTLVLDELLAHEQHDFFVICSSTSAFIAPPGQVDYVAANSFLDAYALARDERVRVVNWGVWSETGMAVRRTVDEMSVELPVAHPWFNTRHGTLHAAEVHLDSDWNAESAWVLNEHRMRSGQAILPGTGYLELFRAAINELGNVQACELSEVAFIEPLAVNEREVTKVRTKMIRTEHGYQCSVLTRQLGAHGRQGWRLHAQAYVESAPLAAPKLLNWRTIESRCEHVQLAEGDRALHTKQADHLQFGPRWQVLRSIALGNNEALAQLTLPDRFAVDLDTFGLHPALMDLATGFAMDLIVDYAATDDLWVPMSYGRLRVHAPLTTQIISWVRNHGENRAADGIASFDITIADQSGRVLVEIECFSIRRLTGGVELAAAAGSSEANIEWESSGELESPRKTSDEIWEYNLSQGIRGVEGVAVFERVLAANRRPQVIATPLDVRDLTAQTTRLLGEQTTDDTQFARPQMANDLIAPRDEIETSLVEIWQKLLGIEVIGVRDNFFELGGHSLIAVRLFSRIKQAFAVDLPISALFEAPTIEKCADLLRARGVSSSTSVAAPAEAKPADARPRFTHLVAMHDGPVTQGRPLFIVAGMFGNVLNLRHLAHLVGQDRPCYGLQARGLYGDEAPHETFEEMAADYLRELRSVQPHGPYLLGGFSGGGIAAYEMARQLLEQGEQVAMLMMLDTPLPLSEPLTLRDKCVIQWQKLQREGWRYVPRMLWQRAVWEYGRRFNRSKTETASEAQFHNTAIEAAFRRACERYALPTLPLTVALFRPPLRPTHVFGPERMINGDRRFIYEDNGWSRVVPQVAVEEVPGDHDSMVLEPNVRVLAARLRSLIEKLERGLDVAPRTVQAPMPVTVAMNSPQGVAEPVSV